MSAAKNKPTSLFFMSFCRREIDLRCQSYASKETESCRGLSWFRAHSPSAIERILRSYFSAKPKKGSRPPKWSAAVAQFTPCWASFRTRYDDVQFHCWRPWEAAAPKRHSRPNMSFLDPEDGGSPICLDHEAIETDRLQVYSSASYTNTCSIKFQPASSVSRGASPRRAMVMTRRPINLEKKAIKLQ